jgi:2-desacetyl-2-hydroxyethyl bacteriochlorophyllide A dehydrogenase
MNAASPMLMPATMRAVVLHGVGDVRVETVPLPAPGPNEALVEILAAGICGSDLHRYRGHDPWSGAISFPRTGGHEIAGRVRALGPASHGVEIGQRVAVEPMQLAGCGRCPACKRGATNICADRPSRTARRVSAGFAEFDVVDIGHLHPLAAKIRFEEAALADVYACAVHALHRVPLVAGMTAVVIGTGPVGLALGQVIRQSGATVILLGRHGAILASALRMGAADQTILSQPDNAADQAAGHTGGRGAEVVFEAAGGTSSETLKMAVDLVMPGGTIAVLGAFAGDMSLPYRLANRKEVTLKFCKGYATWQGRREFRIALDLIEEGQVDARQLITHRFALNDAAEAFRTAADKEGSGAIKVMLTPRPSTGSLADAK